MSKPQLTRHFGPEFMSLLDFVEQHARSQPDASAFIEKGHSTTWMSFDRQANKFAAMFQTLGVNAGDRVGLFASCTVRSFAVQFGLWKLGGVCVPISTMLPAPIVGDLLEDCNAQLVAFETEYEQLCRDVVSATSIKMIDVETAKCNTTKFDRVTLSRETPANIIYSSGTTGDPKGIVHTHGSRTAVAFSLALAMQYTSDSVGYLCIPLHSNGSILAWTTSTLVGAPLCLHKHFDVQEFLDIVDANAPTHGFLVPAICQRIAGSPSSTPGRLSSFDCAVTAGAPISKSLKMEMVELTNGGFAELWGLTEGMATFMRPDQLAAGKEGVGRSIPGAELRIVDEGGAELGPGEEGEIVGRSTGLMTGYWNKPELTAQSTWQSEDGKWFVRTGDTGSLDCDGFLSLRGRLKDMLISGGINVYPVDIEAELLGDPCVTDAAVVAVASERWGEQPFGYIIPANAAVCDLEAILQSVNSKLARHQQLVGLAAWKGDFPRNAMGKVLKNKLEAQRDLNVFPQA